MGFARVVVLLLAFAFFDVRQGIALTEKDVDDYSKLPPSQGCRIIDFENVQVIPGFVNDTWLAVVSGTKPWITMTVTLVPRVYIRQPEYWGIEVVGCQAGTGLPTTAPYTVSTEVHNMGIKGVEIIGANRSEKFNIPPR